MWTLTNYSFSDYLDNVGENAFSNGNNLRCGQVRVANDKIKDTVIKGGISEAVFNEYCPSYELTCKNNLFFSSRTSIMICLYLYALTQ